MRQEHPDIRQHILNTGEAIISGKGFSAVGLAEILAKAGVPKGSFYYYFESKERFGEALLDTYFADYLFRLESLLKADGTPAQERLMRYWRRWVEVQGQESHAQQCLVVKLSAEVSDLSESMRQALRRGTDAILARLSACVAEGLVDGSLPSLLDPEATTQALYQLWLGASLLAKVRRDSTSFETAMRTTQAWLSSGSEKPV
jgi:TetR/AcrR family transcriptional repressor of nem operon